MKMDSSENDRIIVFKYFWIPSDIFDNLQILSEIRRDGRTIYTNEY